MRLELPQPISEAVRPLTEALPLSKAMADLVVEIAPSPERMQLVEKICTHAAIIANPLLQAGLWLYVDDLDRSHTISQGIDGPTGSFWHGIMHRREGDFSNSHYWFKKARDHPAMNAIPGYDGHGFVDAVSARYSDNPLELVEMQREEWAALFGWCASRL